MEINEKAENSKLTVTEPIGCHLQTIGGVAGSFNIPSCSGHFDALLKRDHGQGNGFRGAYFNATIVSIYLPDAVTEKALRERGFELLGTQKGAHGDYLMGLFGQGFTLPSVHEPNRKKLKFF